MEGAGEGSLAGGCSNSESLPGFSFQVLAPSGWGKWPGSLAGDGGVCGYVTSPEGGSYLAHALGVPGLWQQGQQLGLVLLDEALALGREEAG